jgi:hypothetical protein
MNTDRKIELVKAWGFQQVSPSVFVRPVANLHKSNSILITDRRDLIGINQKGGLVK